MNNYLLPPLDDDELNQQLNKFDKWRQECINHAKKCGYFDPFDVDSFYDESYFEEVERAAEKMFYTPLPKGNWIKVEGGYLMEGFFD